MPTFGRIEPFEGGGDEWPAYVERLHEFFFANDVPAAKTRSIFLSCCGPRTYSLLRNLVKPQAPQDKTLSEILTILGKHYAPTPSSVVQRFRFNSRVRSETESVSDFIAALKSLSEHCDYGAELEKMLRDRIVCGINDAVIQTRLLEIPDLTFEVAVQTARAMESAKKDAGELCQAQASTSVLSTHQIMHAAKDTSCYRCGDKSHLASQCRHIHSTCHYCQKRGHLSVVCNSKKSGNPPNSKVSGRARRGQPRSTPSAQVNTLHGDMSPQDLCQVVETDAYDMWHLGTASTVPPFLVTVELFGKPISMELDTGASVSVMPAEKLQPEFPSVKLDSSSVLLRGFSGGLEQVKGKANVNVSYRGHSEVLPLFITSGTSPTLLGRNWFQALGLSLKGLEPVNNLSNVADLIGQYSTVFEEGLGTFKGISAKILVTSEAPPKFCKPRPLPFTLRDRVTQELQRLQREGVIESVKTSDWAALIVSVQKKDGRAYFFLILNIVDTDNVHFFRFFALIFPDLTQTKF